MQQNCCARFCRVLKALLIPVNETITCQIQIALVFEYLCTFIIFCLLNYFLTCEVQCFIGLQDSELKIKVMTMLQYSLAASLAHNHRITQVGRDSQGSYPIPSSTQDHPKISIFQRVLFRHFSDEALLNWERN